LFDTKFRETEENSTKHIQELQTALGESESRRAVIERELTELRDEKDALRGQADKMQILQEMQATEIDRLNLQVGNS
jgi:predicted RNase H-like nuclease (RuvC/YqgF family)